MTRRIPDMEERDSFVLSRVIQLPDSIALAYRGYFPVEDLPTLRHLGSYLQGHPCIHIPGVDMSSDPWDRAFPQQ